MSESRAKDSESVVTHRKRLTREVVRRWCGRGTIHTVLLIGALIMLFPLVWMFLTSVKKQFYMEGENMIWFPAPWQFKYFTTGHYAELLVRAAAKSSGASDNFLTASVNSFIYASITTFGNVLFCAMAGYAFAKKRFRGSHFLLMAMLATMMIPGIMVLLPNFVITVFGLHGYNNFVGLIVPGLASSFGVFLMRQYMLSIPDDLINAAKVDGAGEFRTFFTIVLPLATPIIAAYGILQILGCWNSLLWPLVITKDLTVLQVALLNLREIGSQRLGPVMAGAMISSLPVIVLFLALRKQFVQAMTSGALKG